MDLGLQGRTAFVAASSAGLGLGAAKALAAAGCRVAVNGRDRGRVEQAAASIGGATVVAGDVGSIEGATEVVDRACEALGHLDILVANAGGPPPGTFESTPIEAYDAALALNLTSTVAMCHAAVPAMRAAGWGRVVAITSISVRQPIANLILSNTARTGLTGFLKTLAREVAGDGVTVNSLQPGYHATDRLRSAIGGDLDSLAAGVPSGTVGDPDDFGTLVAFLCSEQARFVTGVALPVDGGQHAGLQ